MKMYKYFYIEMYRRRGATAPLWTIPHNPTRDPPMGTTEKAVILNSVWCSRTLVDLVFLNIDIRNTISGNYFTLIEYNVFDKMVKNQFMSYLTKWFGFNGTKKICKMSVRCLFSLEYSNQSLMSRYNIKKIYFRNIKYSTSFVDLCGIIE